MGKRGRGRTREWGEIGDDGVESEMDFGFDAMDRGVSHGDMHVYGSRRWLGLVLLK